MNTVELLRAMRACSNGIDYVRELHELAPADAWAECRYPRHMLWLLAQVGVERRVIVSIACDIAETVLAHIPAGEDRPRVAIEAARRWVRGEATIEEVRVARDWVRSAQRSTSAAAAYATDTAAYSAYTAAYAAAFAVEAAAYADAAADGARSDAPAYADIIRAHVSYADLEPLLAARLARVAA